jgi:signal transduction histidine kinase
VIGRPTSNQVRALLLITAGALGLGMLVGKAQLAPLDLGALLEVVVGWSFVACGVLLWTRRPANRLGLLMALVGMLWLVGRTMTLVPIPAVFTAGIWLTDLWAAAFVLFLLAFPAGRLTSRADRAIVGIFLFVTVPLEFLWLLFWEPAASACPPGVASCSRLNALAIVPDASAAHLLDTMQRIGFTTGAVLLVIVIGRRWLRSSGPARRQMVPVLAGALAILPQAASWMLFTIGIRLGPLQNLVFLTQIVIPVAVLSVMLRTRMARAGIADLVVEMGHTPTPARLRDALANALGDPTLQVAYWSPGQDRFVDAAGQVMELPVEGTGQAVTMLERNGVREAAIVHDAILLDEPGLIAAVASAMRLAVENDRLSAAVQEQLQEVRASRARIVEAGDLERRRVERDLHDGAQQRLISLSLELRVARSKLGEGGDPAVRQSLDRAAEEAQAALVELRNLALGIHPLILTESGLSEAVESLADRTPIDVSVDIGHERYSAAVEGAAYFVISEALANVTKYAQASKATVRVKGLADHLTIYVEDDGLGGADPRSGSGLRGLADRLAALDGTITVASPAGGGTKITAVIPTDQPTVAPVPAL